MIDVLSFLWDVVYLAIWIVWVAVQTLLHFASPWGDTVGPELDKPALLGLVAGRPIRRAGVGALRALR